MGKKKSIKLWIILISGVLLFFVALIVLSVVFLKKQGDDSKEGTDEPENVTVTATPTATPEPQSKYHVGDGVILGKYEQDANTENGAEDIEWIVLDVKGMKVLLISKYALESMPFNSASGETSWGDSSIRIWLNGEFMDNAFSETERRYLVYSSIENKDYYLGVTENGILKANNTGEGLKDISAHTQGGAVTTDRVFLLSVDEANEYFASEEDRVALFSGAARERFLQNCVEDAKAYGMTDEKVVLDNVAKWEQEHGIGSCFWWLRNPGLKSSYCSIVDDKGETYNSQNVESKEGGVRPVMWVELPEEE